MNAVGDSVHDATGDRWPQSLVATAAWRWLTPLTKEDSRMARAPRSKCPL